jgi:hypothetical protein
VDPRAFLHLARGGDRNLAQACYDIQVALALAACCSSPRSVVPLRPQER